MLKFEIPVVDSCISGLTLQRRVTRSENYREPREQNNTTHFKQSKKKQSKYKYYKHSQQFLSIQCVQILCNSFNLKSCKNTKYKNIKTKYN